MTPVDDSPLTAEEKRLTHTIFHSVRDFCLGDQDQVLARRCSLTRLSPGRRGDDGLGTLHSLPAEVLLMILDELDLASLTNLQSCNRQIFNLVFYSPKLDMIANHAPRVIHAALRVELTHHITLRRLFGAMTSSKCVCCGDFGGYLYLLTCQRVCHRCFTRSPRFLPMLRSEARRVYGLGWMAFQHIPQMISLPGEYTRSETRSLSRNILLDTETARQARLAFIGSTASSTPDSGNIVAQQIGSSHSFHTSSGHDACVSDAPLKYSSRKEQLDRLRRYMAVVPVPTIDIGTDTAEWGFNCLGCYHEYRQPDGDRLFTPQTFRQHLLERKIVNGRHTQATTDGDA
jgi:hypothetical protein